MTLELTTGFRVPLPVAESWSVLLDMERVARWFPGARLEATTGERFDGTVRVKLGPMMVDYRGSATFVERDEDARRVVLEASGREQRGSGLAKAVAVTQLQPDGDGTAVSVSVTLDISGRPAQLGQSLMQDVAQRLVAQFSERMRADLAQGADAGSDAREGPGPAGETDAAAVPGVAATGRYAPDADVLDLGGAVVPELARRGVPFAVALAAVVALVVAVRGWSRSRSRKFEEVRRR